MCFLRKNVDISVWYIPGNIVWDPAIPLVQLYPKKTKNNPPILDTETSFPEWNSGVLVGSIMRVPEALVLPPNTLEKANVPVL